MNTRTRMLVALGLTVAMGLSSGCRREADDLGVAPVQSTFDVTAQASGQTAFTGEAVVLSNPIGGFIVTGSGIENQMDWRLAKVVRVSERSQADAPLAQMAIRNAQLPGDSLRVAISPPLAFRGLASVTAFLELPYTTGLHISEASDTVIVSDMTGDLKVRSRRGVQVVRQTGSCDIRVQTGGADVQIAPPTGGHILIEALSGSITVHMPATISARIDARTDVGSIKTQGFVFNDARREAGILNATINGGAGIITLRARNGSIFLKTLER